MKLGFLSINAGFALLLLSAPRTLAEVTYTTEAGGYILNSGTVTDDMQLSGPSSTTSVGSYHGASTVTIDEGASLTTPNALFIGGKGYNTTGTSGGDGTVIVKNGATLTVGAENSTEGNGAHLDIGNSGYQCTGTLKVDGGTVNAQSGLVVGRANGGRGVIEISNGGKVSIDTTGYQNSHCFQFMNAVINVDNGELKSQGGAATYLAINAGESVEINIRNGGSYTTDGFDFVGYYPNGKATINVEGTGSTVKFNTMQIMGDGGSGALNIKGGATATGSSLYVYGEAAAVSLAEISKLDVDDLVITKEGSLVNDGVLEGSLTLENKAVASGTGTFDVTQIKSNSTLIVGRLNADGSVSAGSQTHKGSLTLDADSIITFAINDFGSADNSMLTLSETATFNVEEGVEVRLYLSDAAIEQTKTMERDISLCLINRENADGTAFVPFANSIEVYDSHGDVVDDITFAGAVDENGKLVINLVPEPTTATLSLLALACLAARRRRS